MKTILIYMISVIAIVLSVSYRIGASLTDLESLDYLCGNNKNAINNTNNTNNTNSMAFYVIKGSR